MNNKNIISINVILLISALLLTTILSAGFYGTSQLMLSKKIHKIEETIRYNEAKYWAHYIEDIHEYSVKIQASVQNDRDLVNDILSFDNSESIANKLEYKNMLNSKIATFSQRLPGMIGTSILTVNGSQIYTGYNVYIATNNIENILINQQTDRQPLFSSTVTENNGTTSYLLYSELDYRYISINLYQDMDFIGVVFLFFNTGSLWGELYDNGSFLIKDKYGNEIINMFESDLSEYEEDEIITVQLSNGWEMQKSTQNLYLSPINQKLIIYLGIGIVSFLFLSLCISLLLFRKPFSYIRNLREFISSYKPQNGQRSRFEGGPRASIRRKLIYYFLLSVIVPSMVLFSILSIWYNKQIESLVTDKYISVLNTAAKSIDKIIERKKAVFKSLLYDYNFQTYLFDKQKFIENNNESYITEVILKYSQLEMRAYDIQIFDYDENLIFSNTIYNKYKAQTHVSKKPYDIAVDQFNRRTLSVYLDFGYIYSVEEINLGRGRLDIPLSELYTHYANLDAPHASIHVTDSGGNILSSNLDDIEDTMLNFNSIQGVIHKNSTNEIIFYSKIGDTPWYLMLVLDWDFLTNEVSGYINLFVSVFIIMILGSTLIITVLSNVICKPLLVLSQKLQQHKAFDDTNYVNTDSRIREVIDMTSQFNGLLDQLDELYDELLISANEKNRILIKMHKAEISALQSQINPHYLSNTLENLTSLIIKGSNEKAIEMINLINTQFRIGISSPNKKIALREEIAYTKAYIEILKIRFDEDIQFIWDIDSSLLDIPIIKLILQPIIENAVKHGLRDYQKENRVVTICAYMSKNEIKINISDNGCGISNEELIIITERIEDNEYYGEHIGLYNVHWRLRLQYGAQYGLTISSILNDGTNVTITLPYNSE